MFLDDLVRSSQLANSLIFSRIRNESGIFDASSEAVTFKWNSTESNEIITFSHFGKSQIWARKKLSFHKHIAFEEIDPQIPTLGMRVYSDFYCISEHLGAWDRGNTNILKIGTKMTSGSLRFSNWIPLGVQFGEARKWGGEWPPKSLIIAESS